MAETTLLVGTTKGAFLLKGGTGRKGWQVSGPHCGGWPINHVVGDPATGRLWAGGGGDWQGAGVWQSSDGGATWQVTRLSRGQQDTWAEQDPDFARMIGWIPQDVPFGDEIKQVWSLCFSHGMVYAGTKPAALLASRDGGLTWDKLDSLTDHPSAAEWQPGAAGLVLHTIVPDPEVPEKLWVGISAAGVFATEDGGRTWARRNRLANAQSCGEHAHPAAPRDGQTGLCVHNMQRAPGDVLYQQNHHGVWRSTDGGRSWEDITVGLPSTFGFPLALHPHDPQTLWTLPLNGDSEGRYPPNAAAAVWKSSDAGQTWAARRDGLPQTACFFTVLRQAMCTDKTRPVGVYFGTNTGSVFASLDEGEGWEEIDRHLPTILAVEALELA